MLLPDGEFRKPAGIEVEQGEDVIGLRLDAKAGENLDNSEIATCLDYTTAKAATSDLER